ncbi:hypothetical protein D3Z60_07885 [Lachnospiraceae bacterium]|jgi:hypothetical protein|nr:hypothetical protein [Lachnospiraceae bacterium]
MTSEKETNSSLLKSRLETLEKSGIKLYLNGLPSTTEYIVKKCVNEDTVYMPDYVTDEEGKVKEIRYDRISFH